MLSIVKQLFSHPNIAIDLGTANTRIYASERGAFEEEPSLIRHVSDGQNGHDSDPYLGYLNSKLVSSPLKGGVIVDVQNAVNLLRPLVKRAHRGFRQPISLACAPTDTSEKERKLLAEAVLHAGASHVAIIPEVWAAAIGAGVDVSLPYAQMLIDIGEGVTDMAVIRDGRLVFATAVRTACADLQREIRNAIIARHKVSPFHHEVQRLTHEVRYMQAQDGSAADLLAVQGMDIIKRREITVEVPSREVIGAMRPVVLKILKMIESGFKRLPDKVACEICETGICLTGGGSCITGMDSLIAARTNLPVRVATDPIHSVINGAIQTLEYWKEKEHWWENMAWPRLPS
ncbi:rod shape-determining protein [Thiovibrio sp. JS02]